MQAVQNIPQKLSPVAAPTLMLAQIEHCLSGGSVREGCVIRIEHTDTITARYARWQTWGNPSFYNGESEQVFDAIAACLADHADHHIRVSIEDYSCHSRFSFVVHKPLAAAA